MRVPLMIAAALHILSGAACAETLETPSTACRTLEDMRAHATDRQAAQKLKRSGECVSIPRGTVFWVERWSAAVPCIRISGFDQCLWTAAAVVKEDW